MSNEFAFIGYPLSINLLKKFDRKFESLSLEELKNAIKDLPPVIGSKITGVRSKSGKAIEGIFVVVLLLPEQLLELDRKFVLGKIIEAGKIAEREQAKIVGLGGLTSVIGRQGEMVSRDLNIAVTTGNTYTAASAIKATLEAADLMEIDLSAASATVIGATGSIGAACSYILSEKVASLNLVARNQKRLQKFATTLSAHGRAKISVAENIDQGIAKADIIIAATSSPKAIINPDIIKSGAVVTDVSVPRNVEEKKLKRDDVLIIDGGLLSPPGDMKIDFDIGLPKGTAYACLCETMILAFENRFENYTLGAGIELPKVKEIMGLGTKHGFKLAGFKSFGKPVSAKTIKLIKEKAKQKVGELR